MRIEKTLNQTPTECITNLTRERLLMVGPFIDEKVKISTRVGLAGSTNKRSITLTLTATLNGKILPFQIIYGAKTDQSLPKFTFPAKFSTRPFSTTPCTF